MKMIRSFALGILASLSISYANADVIYAIDRSSILAPSSFGPAASLVGTITTDGTVGVLHQTNIVDWNLVLSAGSQQVTMHTGNSSLIYESVFTGSPNDGLSASSSILEFLLAPATSFEYSYLAIVGGASGSALPDFFTWCIGTNFCSNDLGEPDEMFLIRNGSTEARTIVAHDSQGAETIGIASSAAPGPSAVPLPGSIYLLGSLGMVFGGFSLWRRTLQA